MTEQTLCPTPPHPPSPADTILLPPLLLGTLSTENIHPRDKEAPPLSLTGDQSSSSNPAARGTWIQCVVFHTPDPAPSGGAHLKMGLHCDFCLIDVLAGEDSSPVCPPSTSSPVFSPRLPLDPGPPLLSLGQRSDPWPHSSPPHPSPPDPTLANVHIVSVTHVLHMLLELWPAVLLRCRTWASLKLASCQERWSAEEAIERGSWPKDILVRFQIQAHWTSRCLHR